MCRLFGLLSTRNASAEPWLVDAERSLLAQSHASEETAQRDGWGIGWYTAEGRTQVVRGVRGAYEAGERERFSAAARESRPPLIVGHLRRASNPLGLPAEQLQGPLNSQPFASPGALFAHNGMIPFPRETRPYLGRQAEEVRGVNDSEVLFRLLLRHYEEKGEPLRAYESAIRDLLAVWEQLGRKGAHPFSGLNVLFSPGPQELWAFCLWTGDHGRGLLDPTRPYYEMTYQQTPDRLVIGSEPFDAKTGAWSPLERGHYLRAVWAGDRIELTRGSVHLPASLEAPLAPSA